MKILITGASGFIGTHLSTELEANGHTVIPVDVKREPLLEDVRRPENVEQLLALHDPDRIIHLAARVGRLFGEDDVAETISDNAAMTATVAKAAGKWAIPLVYASTSEVYGDTGSIEGIGIDGDFESRVHTTHPLHVLDEPKRLLPHNIYGLSKRWGEEACQLYAPGGLTMLRLSMPYGPGLPWGRGRAALINFLHQAITGQPIPVHLGAERSWCYIADTTRAIRMLIEEGASGAYNIGRDDNATSMLQVARMACRLTGSDESLIEEIEPPAQQTVVKRLATDKIQTLGWRPEIDLEDGMIRVRDWIYDEMVMMEAATSA